MPIFSHINWILQCYSNQILNSVSHGISPADFKLVWIYKVKKSQGSFEEKDGKTHKTVIVCKRCDNGAAAAASKSLQLRLTLCDPIDGSPQGPAVAGILQARTLEWIAISSSKHESET